MIVVALVLVMVTVATVRWWWRRRRMVIVAGEAPQFPGALPLVGHSLLFIKDNTQILDTFMKISEHSLQNNGISVYWTHFTPNYVLTDPKDVATVLNSCLDKNYLYDILNQTFGDGLVTADASTWKHHRRMVNPSFSPQVVNTFQSVFDRSGRKFADMLANKAGKGSFDISKYIFFSNIDSIRAFTMGDAADGKLDVDKWYMQTCTQQQHIIMRRLATWWMHSDLVFHLTPLRRTLDRLTRKLNQHSTNIMEKRKIQYKEMNTETTGHKFKPFLQRLLELQATQNAFTDKQVREHVDTMILAGHETTSLAVLYALIVLGSYPHVQDEVYRELVEIFGDSDRPVEKEDLARMEYLEAVIMETQRLYPVVFAIARQAVRDVQLSRVRVPAGASLLVSAWGVHRAPEWGRGGLDPRAFRPERWLHSHTRPGQPASCMTFSYGKRMCIGKQYALSSIKTTLAHVLRRYRVSGDITSVRFKLEIIMTPDSGHHVQLELRQKDT